MHLYIVRHGESYGNIGGYVGPDPELTPLGSFQAARLGERLASVRLDAIYSSPLTRALATADAVASRQPDGPLPVFLLPDLMEVGTEPGYAGLPFGELLKICPTAVESPEPTLAGGGLSLSPEERISSLARAYRAIAYIRATYRGEENVLLSAHGTFNTRLVAAALSFGLPDNFGFSHDNTGLTLVRYFVENGKEQIRLTFLNDTSHLYGVGYAGTK